MEIPTKKKAQYFFKKRVLVIGANGSVGRACSIWLLNQGARVALVSRKIEEIQDVGSQFPSQAICIQCDLAIDKEQFDMVAGAIEALGGLDILLNCAGVFMENDLESTYPQDHDYLIDINLRAVFHITQLCASYLLRTNGCIVNLTSFNRPQQGMISYCMSKAGLDMLTKALALELIPLRVNAVAPGIISNSFLQSNQISNKDLHQIKTQAAHKNPLQRLARIDEIVKTVIFLCSDKGKTINGQVLQVDGGMHCTSSSFINWSTSWKMNSKLLPDGLKLINKFASWFGNLTDKVVKPGKDHPNWVKILMEKSNWYTNLADAHVKVYIDYDHHEVNDDLLGVLTAMQGYDEEDDENPKTMRESLNAPHELEAKVRNSVNVNLGEFALK